MSQKHHALEKAQEQLKVWSQKIDELKAKADLAEAKTQLSYQQEIAQLKAMRQDLSRRIEKFHKAGEAAWTELGKGMEAFRIAFTKALGKFK